MSEESRRPLPVPIAEALDSGMDDAAQAAMWARVQTARKRTESVLPVPVKAVLREHGDAASERSKHWRAIYARRHAPRSARRGPLVFSGTVLLAAAMALLLVWRRAAPSAFHELASSGPLLLEQGLVLKDARADAEPRELTFMDASKITLRPGASLRPKRSSSSRFELVLEQGTADFSVTPGGPRRWTIDAGLARVEVVGTQFRVERDAGAVRVSVTHGKVLVYAAGNTEPAYQLTAGQSVRVESKEAESQGHPAAPEARATPSPTPSTVAEKPAALGTSPEEALRAASSTEPVAGRGEVRQQPSTSATPAPRRSQARAQLHDPLTKRETKTRWREEFAAGHFTEAYSELGRAGLRQATERTQDVDELLSLADVARLSGHAEDAILPLTRILEVQPDNPHAAVAAFTLGRMYLDQLNAPREAARVFERAIGLRPPHALLEDCHARLVQAYVRAEDMPDALRAATRYRTLFPAGRHLGDLERWIQQ